ncbi:MAG: hypothetical protein AB1898_19815 [Acidobacteriota bacterium]
MSRAKWKLPVAVQLSWLFWMAVGQADGATAQYPVGVLLSKGRVSVEGRVEFTQHSKYVDPMVFTGNRIIVREGEAQIELLLGGTIRICSNSELSIMHNRSPYLFLLHGGSAAFDLPESRGDTFFTADFLVRTQVGSADHKLPFKGEIRLDPDGTVCVSSKRGGLVVSRQDNQSMLTVPDGASVRLQPLETLTPLLARAEDCSCLDRAQPKDIEKLVLSLQPHQPKRTLLRRLGGVFRRVLRVVSLGLL